jgi:hypothetical protein
MRFFRGQIVDLCRGLPAQGPLCGVALRRNAGLGSVIESAEPGEI